jgi:RNA processing factor Prp31
MNMTEESLIENHYHQIVEECLANILKEFESGQSKNSPQEHEALCLSYSNLLESNLSKYFYRLNSLTPSQLQSMLMKMDQTLFREYLKNDEHKRIAYLIQLKSDLEKIDNRFKKNYENLKVTSTIRLKA